MSAVTAIANQRFSKSEQIVLVPTVIKTEGFSEKMASKVRVVYNDRYFTNLAADVIKTHFGSKSLIFTRPVMSGEDFSLYQKTIPGVFIHIGGAVNKEYRALHTSKTCVDDKILPIGIEFLLQYVFAYFS